LNTTNIHLDLAPSLPHVLADSNQILHVFLHLAGQVSGQSDDKNNLLFSIRTRNHSEMVLIDFSMSGRTSEHSSEVLMFRSILESDGGPKPTSLSLNACCRIIAEHGGHLLQAVDSGNPAFRVELRVSTTSKNRTSFPTLSRAVARSSS
jgi:light-regulated signal transduction histidine kinase (bacteriophytochrome)